MAPLPPIGRLQPEQRPTQQPAMPHRPGSSPGAALAAAAAVLLAAASAVAPAAARAASFVVETGSMRIRQPQEIAGSFDSAIGDVSGPKGGG